MIVDNNQITTSEPDVEMEPELGKDIIIAANIILTKHLEKATYANLSIAIVNAMIEFSDLRIKKQTK